MGARPEQPTIVLSAAAVAFGVAIGVRRAANMPSRAGQRTAS